MFVMPHAMATVLRMKPVMPGHHLCFNDIRTCRECAENCYACEKVTFIHGIGLSIIVML
jgi:hypothetical protein